MTDGIIVTASGKYVNLLDPDKDTLEIRDIITALSVTYRFNGHTRVPYSVAQHSLYCSYIVGERYQYQALMHDITEAYIGDMVAPLKRLLPDYSDIEHRLWLELCCEFNIRPELHEEVKWADMASYVKERRQLFPVHVPPQNDPDVKVFETIVPPRRPLDLDSSPEEVRAQFHRRFIELRP